MKKPFTLATLCGIASLCFGQGEVSFTSGSVFIQTNSGAAAGRIAGAGNYYFALFVAPTTQTTVNDSLTGWTFTGNYGTNIARAGRFTGNYTTDNAVTVAGFGPGTSANFVIAGWSSSIAGANWSAGAPVLASGIATGSNDVFGMSGIAQDIVLGGGAIPVPNLLGVPPLPGSFTLHGVLIPEPSTFTLACLGAALLFFYRWKRLSRL